MLDIAALAQAALSLAGWGCCVWMTLDREREWKRAEAFRSRLPARTPALTRVLPALPCAGDPLPRFRLTQLDGRLDPDGVVRPPPVPNADGSKAWSVLGPDGTYR